MKIVQECGQKWYRRSSWYRRYPSGNINNIKFRRFPGGIAFGPIMFLWRRAR